MFAGPNGSGKSTMKSVLRPELLGAYVNADELEKEIRAQGAVDLKAYEVEATPAEVLRFFGSSALLKREGLAAAVADLRVSDGKLDFTGITMNSYWAAVAADFVRQRLLDRRASFTFETVMSSRDKVTLLDRAKRLGYRTYLYFVATEDPIINISRIRNRVLQGGHPVPEDKVTSRYARSLDLLVEAIRHTDRTYIFDNSSHEQERRWLAEVANGHRLELKVDSVPAWFKRAVLDKFAADGR